MSGRRTPSSPARLVSQFGDERPSHPPHDSTFISFSFPISPALSPSHTRRSASIKPACARCTETPSPHSSPVRTTPEGSAQHPQPHDGHRPLTHSAIPASFAIRQRPARAVYDARHLLPSPVNTRGCAAISTHTRPAPQWERAPRARRRSPTYPPPRSRYTHTHAHLTHHAHPPRLLPLSVSSPLASPPWSPLVPSSVIPLSSPTRPALPPRTTRSRHQALSPPSPPPRSRIRPPGRWHVEWAGASPSPPIHTTRTTRGLAFPLAPPPAPTRTREPSSPD
ncbi:hypothetical protein B0H13DRAFT_1969879, partial [Mycena leptocephala]